MTDERKRLTAQEAMDLTKAQFPEALAYLGRQSGDGDGKVGRFDCCGHDGYMEPDEGGYYVTFAAYEALRQRAEAAEAERDAALEGETGYRRKNHALHRELTEARAQAAAAWEAGRDAAADTCTTVIKNYDVMSPCGNKYEPIKVQKAAKGMVSIAREDIRALTPPADASAALQAVKDAEWNAAIEVSAQSADDYDMHDLASFIRTLRRNTKGSSVDRA